MSTTAPSTASPSVVRSHSTSARSPSYRPPSSELPHRTRSVAVRPATASQPQHQSPPSSSQYHYQSQSRHSHSHSHSKSQSYDRRPPANQAVFDTIARRDFEASRGAPPVTPRRESSRDRSQERPPTSYRPDSSSNKHRRNLSVQGHQRDSVDMATAGPVMPEGVAGQPQAAAAHLHPANPVQSRRRTMITTPTGQWALGKTLGAGSMGKVKVGKNMDTGEQVSLVMLLALCCRISLQFRWPSRLYLGNRPKSTAARARPNGQTARRKFEQRVRQLSSVSSTILIFVV